MTEVGQDAPGEQGLWRALPAYGRCEVVCFTSDHDASFASLGPAQARLVLDVWADRTQALAQAPHVELVYPFENRGEEIGVTLAHPHGQIYAYPFVPPRTALQLDVARAYRERTSRSLFADVLAAERAARVRVVAEGSHWTAFVPTAARWPVEVHLYPHRQVPDIPALTVQERDDFARVYLDVLRRRCSRSAGHRTSSSSWPARSRAWASSSTTSCPRTPSGCARCASTARSVRRGQRDEPGRGCRGCVPGGIRAGAGGAVVRSWAGRPDRRAHRLQRGLRAAGSAAPELGPARAGDHVTGYTGLVLGEPTLLSDATKRRMHRPQWSVPETEEHYALGFGVHRIGERTMIGHGGGFPGQITRTLVDPQDGLTVVVLTNAIDGPALGLAEGIVKLVDTALESHHPHHDRPDGPPLATFTGRFANLWGVADLVDLGGRLRHLAPDQPDPTATIGTLEVRDADTARFSQTSGFGLPGELVRWQREGEATTSVRLGGSTYLPWEEGIAAQRSAGRVRAPQL